MARSKQITQIKKIRCVSCQVKQEHVASDGKQFYDMDGNPILFRCPMMQHAFGNWQMVEKCEFYRGK